MPRYLISRKEKEWKKKKKEGKKGKKLHSVSVELCGINPPKGVNLHEKVNRIRGVIFFIRGFFFLPPSPNKSMKVRRARVHLHVIPFTSNG